MKRAQGMYRPIVDGYVLPDAVVNIFNARKENRVWLLTGWTEQEIPGETNSARDFQRKLGKAYGADSATFFQWYPASTDSEALVSQARLSRDVIFGVENFVWANTTSKHGEKVYMYRFVRRPPATGEYVKFGAFHTGEVPYAYDNLRFVNRPWTTGDYELANVMSDYWVNFARTGDPNGNGLPIWDAYNEDTKMIMVLDLKSHGAELPDYGALNFLAHRR